jgi:hypothetical protein
MGWTNAKEENIVGRWETFGIISDFKNMKLDPESLARNGNFRADLFLEGRRSIISAVPLREV